MAGKEKIARLSAIVLGRISFVTSFPMYKDLNLFLKGEITFPFDHILYFGRILLVSAPTSYFVLVRPCELIAFLANQSPYSKGYPKSK